MFNIKKRKSNKIGVDLLHIYIISLCIDFIYAHKIFKKILNYTLNFYMNLVVIKL